MTPTARRVTATAVSAVAAVCVLLWSVHTYASAREAGLAEVRAKVTDVQENLKREREDRINADQMFRADLKDIKDTQLLILTEVRKGR